MLFTIIFVVKVAYSALFAPIILSIWSPGVWMSMWLNITLACFHSNVSGAKKTIENLSIYCATRVVFIKAITYLNLKCIVTLVQSCATLPSEETSVLIAHRYLSTFFKLMKNGKETWPKTQPAARYPVRLLKSQIENKAKPQTIS